MLDTCPEIWHRVADLGGHVQRALIQQAAGKDQGLAESLEHAVRLMEDDLLGDSPTMLEQLTTERVVTCWLHLQVLEASLAAAQSDRAEQGYWGRRRDTAHSQYVEAMDLLARLRRDPPAAGDSGETAEVRSLAFSGSESFPGWDHHPSQTWWDACTTKSCWKSLSIRPVGCSG